MLINSLLAENIKKHRRSKGFSQTKLAQKINVSCQAISKWERGVAIPELDKLCLLADKFQISVDELIGNIQNPKNKMIGIDGGGSKTEFLLFDEDGTILETLKLTACNPNSVGIDGAIAVLSEGIDYLRRESPHIQGIFIGSAGFKAGGNGKKIEALLCEKYPSISIRCETDISNVFASAEDQSASIAGICGTGTVVYGRKDNEYISYTGWGYLLDRAGSGFHIGRDAITSALEDLEGLGESTILTNLIENKLGTSLKSSIKDFYQKDSAYIASFAQCVFEAYEKGDYVAKEILKVNAERFAVVINRVAEKTPSAKTVLLSGGVIMQSEAFRRIVQKNLRPDLKIILPSFSQVEGACILCAEMCKVTAEKIYTAFKTQKERK